MIINNDSNEYAEIYQVAHMYYDLNMLQAEIAEKLYLSRPKVSRLLTQARELGIVEIKVNPIISRFKPLEAKLCSLFGIKDAVVVTSQQGKMNIKDGIEQMEEILVTFTAQYVSKLMQTGAVLGITNGSTVDAVLNKISFPEQSSSEIVQLMGASTNSFSLQHTSLILNKIAANHENIRVFPFSVPLYVNDLYLKEVLLQDPNVHGLLQKAAACDVILTELNGLPDDSGYQLTWNGLMGPHHVEELRNHGAVGCICAQYLNLSGSKVPSEWNAKIIAMNVNEFSKIETRIGVAHGLDKLNIILAALRGKILNTLITDTNTASDIIEIEEKRRKKMK